MVEENIIQDNNKENRAALHGINDEYIRFMRLEDSILRQ